MVPVTIKMPATIKTPQKTLLTKKETTIEKKRDTITLPKPNVNIKVKTDSAKKNDSMKELKSLLKKEIVEAVAKKKTGGST